MVESAKSVESFFSMFISPHNGTGIHTDAMMMATQTKEGNVFMVKVKYLRVYQIEENLNGSLVTLGEVDISYFKYN